jgi:hypothetical protein
MMLALLLRRQHRTRERGSAREVVRCFSQIYAAEFDLSIYSMRF